MLDAIPDVPPNFLQLLTMNLREVRAKIEALAQVKSAVVRRDYHGRLTLEVTQRMPVAWIERPLGP